MPKDPSVLTNSQALLSTLLICLYSTLFTKEILGQKIFLAYSLILRYYLTLIDKAKYRITLIYSLGNALRKLKHKRQLRITRTKLGGWGAMYLPFCEGVDLQDFNPGPLQNKPLPRHGTVRPNLPHSRLCNAPCAYSIHVHIDYGGAVVPIEPTFSYYFSRNLVPAKPGQVEPYYAYTLWLLTF
ncbi:hypothetical protein LZ32DRAFT_683105 [Colletotrichum eremochloae]|nr:hypothetical protein LZ32DRAFT_683105 [Colletotrichum eremochloae]